jgi:hypothetical protein
MSEPIAHCVDLDEDAMIEASKIIELEPTDVKFLQMPLYTHPVAEDYSLTDEQIIFFIFIFFNLDPDTELANELDKIWDNECRSPVISKSADMLRQQAKEIEELKEKIETMRLHIVHGEHMPQMSDFL